MMDRDSMMKFDFRLGMSYKDTMKSLASQGIIITETRFEQAIESPLAFPGGGTT